VSLAEISARIGQIQARAQSLASAPPGMGRFGAQFAATLDSLMPRTDVGPVSTVDGALPTSTVTGQADGDDLAAWAARFVGTPYVAGGRSTNGWDCAGFTQWVAGQYGITIPDVSWEQIKQGTPVASMADAKPGDLLFFHEPGGHHHDPSPLGVNHVAIYLGGGKMVEAANPHAGTRISDVDTAHLVGIRRIAPVGDGVPRTPDQVLGAALTTSAVTGPLGAAGVRPTASTAALGTGASGQLGPQELVSVLEQAGFRGEGLRSAWAIAMRESHGRPDALGAVNPNGTRDHGLFQINDIHVGRSIAASDLNDPLANARAAYRMSKGGTDWSAWGIGHTGWARHLEVAQPTFYARINTLYRSWYDRYPAA